MRTTNAYKMVLLRLHGQYSWLFLFCIGILIIVFISSCGAAKDDVQEDDFANMTWDEIVAEAKGTSATMMMYMGGASGVNYMNEYVIPNLKERYNIDLLLVPGQGKEIIASIMSEKEAGTAIGQADLCWINGETFYQLRQVDGLYGPYNDLLPSFKYVDMDNPIIHYDFQEDIKGYETPWSMANFAMVYDSARIANPPASMEEFEQFWQQHPGRFTIPNDFSGYTLLKTWLIEIAGGTKELDGPFDAEKYASYSKQLWKFLNSNKNNFWKNGETFPASNTIVSQMFASGELDFGMSFSNADLDIKIREGVYPNTARPLILKAGSIQNASYVGIPFNSAKKATALVIINFLISPEAQAQKANLAYTGSRTVLNIDKLSAADRQLFDTLTGVRYAIPPATLNKVAIREPVPAYMIRIAEDFRKFVIEAN